MSYTDVGNARRGLLDGTGVVDQFGFVVNVFNTIQFAHHVLIRPVAGLYASRCPNEAKIEELGAILRRWKKILSNLEPEQRARFERDHPGEFEAMMESIEEYEDRLDEFTLELTDNPWARYLPIKAQLSQEWVEICTGVKDMNKDYKTTTKQYRTKSRFKGAQQTTTNTATHPPALPAAGQATMIADHGDVEMLPISTATTPEITEQRVINRDTMNVTEQYRQILRVYPMYSVPSSSLRDGYAIVRDFMASLGLRGDSSDVFNPA
ncbi:hypothetical protein BD309DRAFT_945211 [Dichomitus squalens]|uniref:Uncharacterized protein n=1 Tax=Dichomitus squalens TaxID=114155 RepID=A0A4Q9Q327_9APHY|nr:uncharacterized protein DICSQDRAFT_160817 [Dichomitus squalens LYAD-421 SS1]EJF63082.1 hypothetical protein DICSQDRAFT_160817 [Dichomitus squalens LYAD-421 SS1]TBU50535.1 hypothetical protein BD309DRAFT_945211 [Dichomitus squalens]TBU61276.1 hypothetical protein BD310DRAFT_216858 [Dichomitus squalens]